MATIPAVQCDDPPPPAAERLNAAYRLFFDANPEPMWIFDSESFRFLAVNDATVAKYGYTREELLSMSILDFRDPDDVPSFLKYHAALPSSASLTHAGIWKHRTKSGAVLHMEILSGSIDFEGKRAELIVAKDMTACKQTTTALSLRSRLTGLLAGSAAEDYSQVLECLCTGLGFDVGEVWQKDVDGSCCLEQVWHAPSVDPTPLHRLHTGFRVPAPPGSSLDRILASGSLTWIPDLDPQISPAHRDILLQAGMHSGIASALCTKETVHGVLALFSRRNRRPDSYELDLLRGLISQVAQHVERNRTQRSLRQAEADFRKLFDEAPVPYHEIDRNGVVTRVNRAECELLGFSPAEMIGRPVWEFVAADQRQESRAAVLRKLSGEQPLACYERKYRGQNGAEIDLETYERLITDEKGQVTGIRTAMLDLSSYKRAQGKIAYQAQLLDSVDDAIFGLDDCFRVAYMNRAAEQWFGWTRDEALGRNISVVAPAQLDEATRDAYHQEAVGKGHWHGEIGYFSRQGQPIVADASASMHYAPDGQPQGVALVLRDVSERKRAEQALRASEARLKMVQKAAGVSLWDWNLVDNTLQCAETTRDLCGLPPGTEMTPARWESCIHPDDRDRMSRTHAKVLESGREFSHQFRVLWPDGSVHWLLGKGRVLRDAQNRPVRMVGVNLDITEHKLVEDRLRILSMAVEQSPVSILITDLQGNIQYVNPRVTEVTGYSPEELIGRNPRILKSGETAGREYRHLWRTIPYGEWRGIFHNRKKNGDLFWEAASICPIRDEHGKTTHYLAVKEDITAQREMEEALRISEERFRIAAKNTADLIYDLDLRTNKAVAFGAIERCFGGERQAQPVSHQDFQRLVHPDDRDRVVGSIERHIASGEPFQAEYRVVLANGSVRNWQDRGQALRDELGKPYRWIGVINDITETRLAERANAELAAIVAGSDAAIISKDLAGNILTWNPGAQRIYGYPAAVMRGRNVSLLIPEDRRQEQAGILDQVSSGKEVSHLETARRKNDGSRIDVLISVSPVRDSAGTIVAASDIAWDITEFKRLQRQLAQAQKLESIGQLAAGIAHEINTPIQYIGDNAAFLEDAFADLVKIVDSPSDPGSRPAVLPDADVAYLKQEIPKSIHQLLDGVNHVARIVRAMKEFSHPGPVEKVPADLNRAIESTILVARNEWKYVADLVTRLDPDLPPVTCIVGEINQVMLNLIVNAAHAIAGANRGGEKKGVITVATRRDGAFAEIRVSDTGTGIPEAIRSRIFDPFFTTKEVGKGTGQGLAIAHAVIVQTHRGTIHFETRTGVGTTFIVRLPLGAEENLQ